MSEVSCKVFDTFWEALAMKGVDRATLVEHTNVEFKTILDKKARLSWSDFCAVMHNIRPHFTDGEYIELGRAYLHAPGLRFAMVIARLAMAPMDFYRWFSKPDNGVGNQMFACITPSHRELAPYDIELDLVLPEGYEVLWDFYLISQGNMEEMSVLLGYQRAEVALTRIPHGGRMRIKVPQGAKLYRRALRFLAKPFVRRDAAKELRSAHEELLGRYHELESAQMKLDRQAVHLQTAHRINELAQGATSLEATLAAILAALVDGSGFAWARITLVRAPTQEFTSAARPQGVEIVRPLLAREGETIGEVAVIAHANVSFAEALLDFVCPTIAITLENVLYRTQLESRVAERTAELSLAHDQLSATVVGLKEAQGVRERFFGNISHEIRTPLSLILLATADVEKRTGPNLDARSREGLASVSDSARKLVRLVDELLLLAAAQEDQLGTKPEPTDLATLCTRLADSWRLAAESHGQTLNASIPGLLVANVDPVQMERVITNLVSNAIKYNSPGGAVLLEVSDLESGIRISVFDTGPGIDEELSNRLFGRFERSAGEASKKQGTGLGLNLSKQIIEAHGGTIQALPRSGGGAELRVDLPPSVRLSDTAAPSIKRSTMVARVTDLIPTVPVASRKVEAQGVSEGTILLAEDDVRLASAIADLLSESYTVIVAHDGATALELAKTHKPQLLVTDVEMPGLSGIELARAFRGIQQDTAAPVVILSAVMDLRTRVEGLDAGAVDYVTKPFDPLELKARVRAQFRLRDLGTRLHRAEQVATLGFLTTGLAHELRNPANGIVNAIEPILMLLPDELKEPDHPIAQLVSAVSESAEQIRFLARQLLGFKRADATVDMAPAPLRSIIDRALSLASTAFAEVEARVEVGQDALVRCSAPLLTQVFTNLLENAAHAAGPGGWVAVRLQEAGGRMTVEVTDSGPGVPADLRTRVFEPFFTTKPAGVGNGLGLPLSRDIVMRHGGVLEIRGDGQNAAFVVELPGVITSVACANAV